MSYASASDLTATESAQDLAEALAPDHRAVTGDVLKVAIAHGDLSHLEPDDAQAALLAAGELTRVLSSMGARIDAHVRSRYPALVETPHADNAELLKGVAVNLAAWTILGGDPDSDRRRRHDDAMNTLNNISNGRITLATADPVEDSGGAEAHSDTTQFASGVSW